MLFYLFIVVQFDKKVKIHTKTEILTYYFHQSLNNSACIQFNVKNTDLIHVDYQLS